MSDTRPPADPSADPAQPAALEQMTRAGSRRRKRSRLSGCLPVLLVLAVLGGLGYVAVVKGQAAIEDYFADPADFSGPGRGDVFFEVADGETVTEIGRNLKAEGVTASVDAFLDVAEGSSRSRDIQVGYYGMAERMSAAEAFEVLVDPANLVNTTVTVPEGLRVADILDILGEDTDFPRGAYARALQKPEAIGLPAYADGDPEGYLFPSTYDVSPGDTPVTVLTAMVDRWRQAADDAGLEERAEELGYTPHELMTVASLVEAEGRGDDMPKVARVIYNRLEIDPNPSAGFLQIDAAVNFALGREPIARLTTDEIDSVSDSPYNTYTQKGLPPGPIEAPGDSAIAAAANPAEGPWFFYVTVDLRTGETKFTESYDEFLGFRAELDEYCATQSDRC